MTNDQCAKCKGGGWVCENHKDHPWNGECCGGAGEPCDCNTDANVDFAEVIADSKVVSLEAVREIKEIEEAAKGPWFNVLALCLTCHTRWVGTVHFQTPLFALGCPGCNAQNSFVSFIPNEYTGAIGGADNIR